MLLSCSAQKETAPLRSRRRRCVLVPELAQSLVQGNRLAGPAIVRELPTGRNCDSAAEHATERRHPRRRDGASPPSLPTSIVLPTVTRCHVAPVSVAAATVGDPAPTDEAIVVRAAGNDAALAERPRVDGSRERERTDKREECDE